MKKVIISVVAVMLSTSAVAKEFSISLSPKTIKLSKSQLLQCAIAEKELDSVKSGSPEKAKLMEFNLSNRQFCGYGGDSLTRPFTSYSSEDAVALCEENPGIRKTSYCDEYRSYQEQ